MSATALLLTVGAGAGQATAAPSRAGADSGAPAAVAAVDLERYLGSWYQVAALPQLFELQCARNVKATYTRTAAGTVGVRNTCTTWLNTTSSVTGDARPLDATNARLNVSFLGLGGTYLHTDRANYIVTGLDPDYRWAVVTDSDRRSGFVLSRTPSLTSGQRSAVLSAIRSAGLDPCRFRVTRQDDGAAATGSLC
ncbi:hypothetical protein AQJ66_29650 [Streptomyces bungoensis]|uniref:Lipocalin/cytosolic fatty-acid binding domain-containing protein n=1 Tax=Streptomyces bungoensis TaxID=285568 RepID=A0A101SRW1_9ACTN|nr:hypothetical protein AQJ66_29650 [Streptomyces bungoensis]